MYVKNLIYDKPGKDGFFGDFGGAFVDENMKNVLNELENAFEEAYADENFLNEIYSCLCEYAGRPSPLYFAGNLTKHYGKGKIYLKREDLNHTGSHKINNVIGQAFLAKRMGKNKIIAETGAGQHGVATATACALLGLECKVFMGERDIKRQYLNVERMKLLKAEVISVQDGAKTLKDACDAAIKYWVENARDTFYVLGSVVGPHPYPKMVRCFQSIIGAEIKKQILELEGRLPNYVLACVGGGSNAMGAFYAFLDDKEVNLIGLEAGGEGIESSKHAASLTAGEKIVMHGMRQYVLTDGKGNPVQSQSISAGLDYPGCGPEHCFLKDSGRAKYYPVTDYEAIKAFGDLSKIEGIIPAIESSHAVAYLEKLMPQTRTDDVVVVNISGRGDKDGERLIPFFE